MTVDLAQATAQPLPAGHPAHALAQDLRTLAWLHRAERDAATWVAMHAAGFPQGLVMPGAEHPAVLALSAALQSLGSTLKEGAPLDEINDRLAADFAGIYLTHALRASPCESVWRDEDHLLLQAPTFEVREVYRRHGLKVPDWRNLPDDHLAHELDFVAHLLERGQGEAARLFLAEHLLMWLPQFAQQVGRRADTAIYAGLAEVTLQACTALRQALQPAAAGAAA